MTKYELSDQIKTANQLISSWPAWKQNNLIQASMPTVSTPRTPVNNQAIPAKQQNEKQTTS